MNCWGPGEVVTVEERGDGTVAVSSLGTGPAFLLVTLTWLQELVTALYDEDLLAVNGKVKRETESNR